MYSVILYSAVIFNLALFIKSSFILLWNNKKCSQRYFVSFKMDNLKPFFHKNNDKYGMFKIDWLVLVIKSKTHHPRAVTTCYWCYDFPYLLNFYLLRTKNRRIPSKCALNSVLFYWNNELTWIHRLNAKLQLW